MSKIAQQLKAMDMEKPQLLFEDVPTNHEVGPFKPLLTSKPHAIVPLEQSLHTEASLDGTSRQMYSDPISFHSHLERELNASFYLMRKDLPFGIRELVNDKIRYR